MKNSKLSVSADLSSIIPQVEFSSRVKAYQENDNSFKGAHQNHHVKIKFNPHTFTFTNEISRGAVRDTLRGNVKTPTSQFDAEQVAANLVGHIDNVLSDLLGADLFLPDVLDTIELVCKSNDAPKKEVVIFRDKLVKALKSGKVSDIYLRVVKSLYEVWLHKNGKDYDYTVLGDLFPANEQYHSFENVVSSVVSQEMLTDLKQYLNNPAMQMLIILKGLSDVIGNLASIEAIMGNSNAIKTVKKAEHVSGIVQEDIEQSKTFCYGENEKVKGILLSMLDGGLFRDSERISLSRKLDLPSTSVIEVVKEELSEKVKLSLEDLLGDGVGVYVGWKTVLDGWEQNARDNDPDFINHMLAPPIEALRIMMKLKDYFEDDSSEIGQVFDCSASDILVEGFGDHETGVLKGITLVVNDPFKEGLMYANEIRISIRLGKNGGQS